MVPVTVISSGYIVPEKRGAALADPRPGTENSALWEHYGKGSGFYLLDDLGLGKKRLCTAMFMQTDQSKR